LFNFVVSLRLHVLMIPADFLVQWRTLKYLHP